MPINQIKILSPGPACRRTRRILRQLERYFEKRQIPVNFEIETDLEKIKQYETWLLPTILINGTIVSRGYFPPEKLIESHLTTESHRVDFTEHRTERAEV